MPVTLTSTSPTLLSVAPLSMTPNRPTDGSLRLMFKSAMVWSRPLKVPVKLMLSSPMGLKPLPPSALALAIAP